MRNTSKTGGTASFAANSAAPRSKCDSDHLVPWKFFDNIHPGNFKEEAKKDISADFRFLFLRGKPPRCFNFLKDLVQVSRSTSAKLALPGGMRCSPGFT